MRAEPPHRPSDRPTVRPSDRPTVRPSPLRAVNGTRTRDPNLGKVVLYQLSYSRMAEADCSAHLRPPQPFFPVPAATLLTSGEASGGEGDRTPDLVNAIHALSQLSYAPIILGGPRTKGPEQHGNL